MKKATQKAVPTRRKLEEQHREIWISSFGESCVACKRVMHEGETRVFGLMADGNDRPRSRETRNFDAGYRAEQATEPGELPVRR